MWTDFLPMAGLALAVQPHVIAASAAAMRGLGGVTPQRGRVGIRARNVGDGASFHEGGAPEDNRWEKDRPRLLRMDREESDAFCQS